MFTMAQRGPTESRKHRDTMVSTCFGAYFKLSVDSKLEKAPKCRLPPPPALHSKVPSGLNTQAPMARLPGPPASLLPKVLKGSEPLSRQPWRPYHGARFGEATG